LAVNYNAVNEYKKQFITNWYMIIYTLRDAIGIACWMSVEFGDHRDSNVTWMSEHRQRDRRWLREMQHYATGDEDTQTKPCRPADDKNTFGRDKNTVKK